MSKKYLITDCWGIASFNLMEGKEEVNGRVTFRGPYTEYDAENRNKRVYPERVMRPEFDRLAVISERYGLLGELDHPQDSTIHLERASHRISKLWWEKPKVGWGEATTISTPAGLVLEALFHENVPVGISSRGVGQGFKRNGVTMIEEGFRLITFDTVADPSYQSAWQEIRESVFEDINKGRVKVPVMENLTHREQLPSEGSVITTRLESLEETIRRADESNNAHPVKESKGEDVSSLCEESQGFELVEFFCDIEEYITDQVKKR